MGSFLKGLTSHRTVHTILENINQRSDSVYFGRGGGFVGLGRVGVSRGRSVLLLFLFSHLNQSTIKLRKILLFQLSQDGTMCNFLIIQCLQAL